MTKMTNEEEMFVHNKYFIRRKFYIPKEESTRDYGVTPPEYHQGNIVEDEDEQ